MGRAAEHAERLRLVPPGTARLIAIAERLLPEPAREAEPALSWDVLRLPEGVLPRDLPREEVERRAAAALQREFAPPAAPATAQESTAAAEAPADRAAEPYPNWHAARQRDPADFERIVSQPLDGVEGVVLLGGPLKGADSNAFVVQAVRFRADAWTEAAARAWLAEHDYRADDFEPASGEA